MAKRAREAWRELLESDQEVHAARRGGDEAALAHAERRTEEALDAFMAALARLERGARAW